MQHQLEGEGPAVVIIHGLFGDLDNLNNCAQALQQAGFTTIRINLPGHGDEPLVDQFEFVQVAEQLEQLRQSLQLHHWSVLGHSLGGKVAMTYAQLYPEVTTAILVADIAPVAYHSRHTAILEQLPKLDVAQLTNRRQAQQQLMQAGIDMATAAFLCKNLTPLATGGFRWRIALPQLIASYPVIIGKLPQLPSFDGPVMMVKGANSDYVLPEHRPAILARFPNARAHVINGAGHWLHAEKAEQFNRLCVRFFESTTNL